MPTFIIYIYGIITGTFLIGEATKTLLPHLLLTSFFWRGWLSNIDIVVGYPAFFSAILGVLFIRPCTPRAFLGGIWAGYAVFSLALNYNVATHDYYQLQLIPIIALSLGPLVALIARHALALNKEWYWRGALAGLAILALALSLGSAYLGLAGPNTDRTIRIAEEIGEQVDHDIQTIFLASDYGVSLEYHGQLAGEPWPLKSDIEWERIAGVEVLIADDRFQTWFAPASPTYFIVLDLREYEQQPDLMNFLSGTYPIFEQNEDYIIFDLR
jgi:hypothetical protein